MFENPLRLLKFLYPASCAGVALFSLAVAVVTVMRETPIVLSAATWFYAVALGSLLAIAGGFWTLRRLEQRLPEEKNEAAANETILLNHLLAMGALEASALLAIVATFLTHDLMTLAFVVPFFAFAWLTWPSEEHLAWWHAVWSNGREQR